MKHRPFKSRIFRDVAARTFAVRAARAWRELMPDWTPNLDDLRKLDDAPREYVAAVKIVAKDWSDDDPRWDVFMALLEWNRRDGDRQVSLRLWEKSLIEGCACCGGPHTWDTCPVYMHAMEDKSPKEGGEESMIEEPISSRSTETFFLAARKGRDEQADLPVPGAEVARSHEGDVLPVREEGATPQVVSADAEPADPEPGDGEGHDGEAGTAEGEGGGQSVVSETDSPRVRALAERGEA